MKYNAPTPFLLMLALLLSACESGRRASDDDLTLSPRKATSKPYQIKGVWYYPQHHYELDETGISSYYGGTDVFHGRKTATGEVFDMDGLTAAHKTLPLPCVVTVTNLDNGKSLQLKVNDRGPFVNERIIDVSRKAAELLGFYRQGTAKVRVVTDVEASLSLSAKGLAVTSKADTIAAAPVLSITSLPMSSVPADVVPAVVAAPLVIVPAVISAPKLITMPSVKTAPALLSPKVKQHRVKATNIYVMVGLFPSQAKAQTVTSDLGLLGMPAQIVPKALHTTTVFQVRVGPIDGVHLADKTLDQLIASGFKDARIVIMR